MTESIQHILEFFEQLSDDQKKKVASEIARRATDAAPSALSDSTSESATLADFLSAYIGVIQSGEQVSGGAQMSARSGGKLAKGMVKKRGQGHL